jgi:hypothetical protein
MLAAVDSQSATFTFTPTFGKLIATPSKTIFVRLTQGSSFGLIYMQWLPNIFDTPKDEGFDYYAKIPEKLFTQFLD